ncbi:MAG: hypothetical protein NPIRA05_22330 [Nitrospirales bacterium]|nr:MAG: hypothetical protein NPIRA05_22330 [Nitrospirales bacterium]
MAEPEAESISSNAAQIPKYRGSGWTVPVLTDTILGDNLHEVFLVTKRQTYSMDFKLEVVQLLESGDKTATELALQLGVRRILLYKWQEQIKKEGAGSLSRGVGRPKADQLSEIERLRIKNLRM